MTVNSEEPYGILVDRGYEGWNFVAVATTVEELTPKISEAYGSPFLIVKYVKANLREEPE